MMKYCFIAVNYGTSHIIKTWIDSINQLIDQENIDVIIIDNFKSDIERMEIVKLASELNFTLIESENVGYGAGLNRGIQYALKNIEGEFIFFAGNLDLEYKNIPKLAHGKYVYVPQVMEGNRNRNPFLTKLQHRITPLYKLAGITKNPLIYYCIITINKLIGIIPSRIWAVHGSLFCFHSSLLEKTTPVFNDNSFLYGEELEFASYMESQQASLISSDILVEHASHVCTQDINNSKSKFLDIWWPSFENWNKRWN